MLSQEARSLQSNAMLEPTGIVVTATDLNPVVQIVTWLLLALASLMLCFRHLTKAFLKANRKPGLEDVLVFGAYAIGVGESVTMLLPGSRIFGKAMMDISSDELREGMKIGYTRDMLFILSLGLAKLSVNAGILALSPDQKHRRLSFVLGAIIAVWMLTSFLAMAFQCGSSGPWDRESSDCFNQRRFYQYLGITNIVTDAALIALPVAIIWPLRMPWTTRATALAFFMCRILVIATTIVQLVYIPRLFDENWTLIAWPYFLFIQLVQFTSISAACMVYFLPFLRSLQSGLPWATTRAFSSSYTLSKTTRSTIEGNLQASVEDQTTRITDRRDYIKITTENQVVSRTRS